MIRKIGISLNRKKKGGFIGVGAKYSDVENTVVENLHEKQSTYFWVKGTMNKTILLSMVGILCKADVAAEQKYQPMIPHKTIAGPPIRLPLDKMHVIWVCFWVYGFPIWKACDNKNRAWLLSSSQQCTNNLMTKRCPSAPVYQHPACSASAIVGQRRIRVFRTRMRRFCPNHLFSWYNNCFLPAGILLAHISVL